MSSKSKQSRQDVSADTIRKEPRPWRERLSTKVISSIVALSLVLMVPLPAFADNTNGVDGSDSVSAAQTQDGAVPATDATTQANTDTAAMQADTGETTQAGAIANSEEASAKSADQVEQTNLSRILAPTDSAAAQDSASLAGATTIFIKIATQWAQELIGAIYDEWAAKDGDNAVSIGKDGQDTVIYIHEQSFPKADGSDNWNPYYGGGFVVHGHVTLVIKDGVTFTLGKDNYDNSICEAGILVNGDGNSLTICAGNDADKEVKGTGKLIVYGGYQSAGIGGSDNINRDRPQDGTNITIESATVEATGGEDAAGIGGGNKGCSDNIVINGGTVKATAGIDGAGIGSGASGGSWSSPTIGWYRNDGKKVGGQGITINGGTVTATSISQGAAIGGGFDSDGHNIEINGGTVVATAGYDATGIGCGYNSVNSVRGYNIHIGGGSVTAKSDHFCAAIGSTAYEKAWGILIDGDAYVKATSGAKAAAIGGGFSCFNVTEYIEIGGNAVVYANEDGEEVLKDKDLNSDDWDYTGIGSGVGVCNETVDNIKIGGNAEVHAWGHRGAAIGSGRNGQAGDITLTGNCKVYATNRGDSNSGKAGSAIGSGCNYGQKGSVTIENTGDIYVEAHTLISGYTAIGWGKKESGSGNQDVRIDAGLTVYRYSPFEFYFTSTSDGNCAEKLKGQTHLLVKNDAYAGPEISAEQTSPNPSVGYESTTSYDVTSNFVCTTSDYEIEWFKDAACTQPGGAPAYATVEKGVSAFGIYTCPDQSLAATDYGVTPAGTYYFRLKGTYCGKTCYSDVLTYTVEPREVNVRSGSATKIYDGAPLSCETITQDEVVVAQKTSSTTDSPAFEVKDTVVENAYNFASVTTSAESPKDNTFDCTLKSKYAGNYSVVKSYGTLTVVPDTQFAVVTGEDYSGVYDAAAHYFAVKVVGKNGIDYTDKVTLEYATSTDRSTWTAWSSTAPTVKDVGKIYVKAKASATGTSVEAESAVYTMEVTQRNVTLTSMSATKEYDGTELTSPDVAVGGDGFVDGEGFATGKEAQAEGTITKVGSVPNTISSYELSGSTKAENYTISKAEGTLTVTKKSAPITISTASASKTYDGAQLKAEEYSYTDGVLATGDTLSVVWTSGTAPAAGDDEGDERAFNAGTHSNSLESYKVTNSATGDDVTGCYTFTDPHYGTLTIYPRNITLASGSAWKVYDGSPLSKEEVTVSGDGLVAGEDLAYSDFAELTEICYTPVDNTFVYKAAAGSNFNAGNYVIDVQYGKLMVVDEIGILATDQTFTYDGTAHEAPAQLVASSEGAASKLTYSTSTDGTTWTAYSEKIPSLKDAGTLYVKAKGEKGGQTVEESYTVTVNPRPVTISTASAAKVYDGTALTANRTTGTALDYTISGQGFASGEGAKVTITGTQTLVGASSNAFSYELTGDAKAKNYTISEQPGTLTVVKNTAPIAIATGSDVQAYSGTPLSCASYTATWGGTAVGEDGALCVGDVLSVTPTGSITDVGSTLNTVEYRVLRGSVDVTDCYTFQEPTLGTLQVTPRTIVLTSASAAKVYDGTPLTKNNTDSTKGALDYVVSGDGFVSGQGFDAVNITGTRTDAGTAANTIGYVLNAATDPGNYTISTVAGTLTVSKRKVTVTSGSAVAVEPGPATNSTVEISGDGFVDGELTYEATGKQTEVTVSADDVKAAENTVSYTWHVKAETGTPVNDGNPANYEITENLGKLVVVTSGLMGAVTGDYTGVYDGGYHTGAVTPFDTTAAIKYSNDEGVTYTLDAAPTYKDAGSYTVYVQLSKDANKAYYTYDVNISPRPLTLTAGSATKVYDGTALTCADYTIGGDGFVVGEEQTIAMTAESKQKDAGTHDNEIVQLADNDTFKTANYSISYANGTLEVTKRPVIIYSLGLGLDKKTSSEASVLNGEANAALAETVGTDGVFETLLYDGADHSQMKTVEVGKGQVEGVPTIENMGFADGEGADISGFGTFKDAGLYRNSFTMTLKPGTDKDNYTIKTIYGVVKITPRSVVLSSADDSKPYDGEPLKNSTVNVLDDKFAAGEGASYEVTGSQTEVGMSANTFSYELEDGTLAINYEITTDEGTLTVYDNDTLRLEAKTQEYTYDGKPHGEAARAYIGDALYEDGTIWYSVDGGVTYTDDVAQLTEPGTLDVLAYVDKRGYERAEAAYKIIVTKATDSNSSSKASTTSPTGDSTGLFVGILLAIIVAAVIVALVVRKRKGNR